VNRPVTELRTGAHVPTGIPSSSEHDGAEAGLAVAAADTLTAPNDDVSTLKSDDPDMRVRKALIDAGKVTATEFRRLMRIKNESAEEKSVVSLLIGLGLVSEQYLAELLAETFDLPLMSNIELHDVPESRVEVSHRFLIDRVAIAVKDEDGSSILVVADPGDDAVPLMMRLAYDSPLSLAVATQSDIENAIEQLYGDGKSAMGQIVDSEDNAGEDDADLDVEQLKDMASEAPVIRLVNLLLQGASEASASDIHIEPFEGQLKVRYRIDGVLNDVEAPPQKLAAAVISRIKIMAKLNIAERRLPQDGRIRLKIQGSDIDARVSTIPTMHGESVVMRLLNRSDVALDLTSLGFPDSIRDQLLDILHQPNGMILVTGPTGSGKTTTLYAAIELLNTEERKIITAEDPVEYQMRGVNQIQVKPAIGLTFSNVLRSIVRQDPDVILVGEMRDLETAKICVQSALTGHLVLSTLHTNSAASSVTRLLEMGIEDYLLTSTVSGVLSQRLVRKLCVHCREPYTPDAGLIKELKLETCAESSDITLYRPVGCDKCNATGYRGRQSILELLTMNDAMRKLVHERNSAKQIEMAAIEDGMRTIYQDGCDKALAGITSIDEVLRVIQDG
jgi:general secretion pathway protein E